MTPTSLEKAANQYSYVENYCAAGRSSRYHRRGNASDLQRAVDVAKEMTVLPLKDCAYEMTAHAFLSVAKYYQYRDSQMSMLMQRSAEIAANLIKDNDKSAHVLMAILEECHTLLMPTMDNFGE